jgi:hypothetical protein
MTSRSARGPEPPFGFDLRRLGNIKRGEVGRRFVLGAGASLLAGGVTLLLGPRAGGLFLAFPAILLASLTLLEKKEGRAAAVASSEGAVLGAIGLAVFALVFEAVLPRSGPGLAFVLALAGWIGTSVALYAAVEVVGRRRT